MSVAGQATTTVTTSRIRINTICSNGADARLLQNTSDTVTVYLGDSTVTTSSFGVRLKPDTAVGIPPGPLEIYGVASATSAVVTALGG